jgi:hypothetical protein
MNSNGHDMEIGGNDHDDNTGHGGLLEDSLSNFADIELDSTQSTLLAKGWGDLLNRLLSCRWMTLSSSALDAPELSFPGVYIISWGEDVTAGDQVKLEHVKYVGMSNSIRGTGGRLRQFLKAATGGTAKHSGGKRLRNHVEEIDAEPGLSRDPVLLFQSMTLRCTTKKSERSAQDLRVMGLVTWLEYELLALVRETNGEEPFLNSK